MHVDHNQCVQCYWLIFGKLPPNQFHRHIQLLWKCLKILIDLPLLYILLHLRSPLNLTSIQHTLSRMNKNPIRPRPHGVIFYWMQKHTPYWRLHQLLHLCHPVLHILSFRVNHSIKCNPLSLCTQHRHNRLLTLSVKLNLIDVLKYLVQVRLDRQRLLCLRQNLQ